MQVYTYVVWRAYRTLRQQERIMYMIDKMKRKFGAKLLLSLVLALVLSVAVVAPAFAAPNDSGTPGNPAGASVRKDLVMPAGTTTPNLAFQFTFTPVQPGDLISGTTTTAVQQFPGLSSGATIATQTVEFPAGYPTTLIGGQSVASTETGNVLNIANFPHAGHFLFRVTETPSLVNGTTLSTVPPGGTGIHETLQFDTNEYYLRVFVRNVPAPGSGLYFAAAFAYRIVDGEVVDEKVDPTPGSSNMVFTNLFTRTTITDPVYPEPTSLIASKMVAGDMADRSRLFSFTATLTAPSVVTTPPGALTTVTAQVVQTLDAAAGWAPLVPPVTVGAPITFTFNAAGIATGSFQLSHGQQLVFIETPVGMGFEFTEAAEADYRPSVVVTVANNNTGGTAVTIPTNPADAVVNTTLSTGNRITGDGEQGTNSAAFTNTYRDVPITGLFIESIPFVIALGVLAALLAMMVASRSRRRIEELPIAY